MTILLSVYSNCTLLYGKPFALIDVHDLQPASPLERKLGNNRFENVLFDTPGEKILNTTIFHDKTIRPGLRRVEMNNHGC
ncbi:MAG: hypothetical protein OEV24_02820 [Cyclobacteriaceae bacterium]|nr:hypothetical protein [Cyclobacteriaceae bacterium]MDH5249453.1 hypothetical protein [Cyclobacteriaceae bacterium]